MYSKKILLALISLYTIIFNAESADVDELLVQTLNGKLRGKTVYPRQNLFRQYRVNAWLGIPFAQPPVNNLRFKRPVPVQNWTGELNCTAWKSMCAQKMIGTENPNAFSISEDCLYVNVMAPSPKPSKAAVMVWIHGGGFQNGGTYINDQSMLVAESNVIVVTIQYRLNIFGFLYLGTNDAPGNQGLLDQQLALKWVKDNIAAFGGDNNKITIFGHDAGSASVSYHLISPLSTNLYGSAIMESGSALSPWAFGETSEMKKRANDVFILMGCTGNDITCARGLDAQALANNVSIYFRNFSSTWLDNCFKPVVDNYFLLDSPAFLIKQGKFKKCPILLGVNKEEGSVYLSSFDPELFTSYDSDFYPNVTYSKQQFYLKALYKYYPLPPKPSSAIIKEAIVYRYTNWNNVENFKSNLENLIKAVDDYLFTCPVIDFATAYAQNKQDVYFYHFTQRSSISSLPKWFGVANGDDVQFVFGKPLAVDSNYSVAERYFTRKLIRYWTNFAKYGSPNDPASGSCIKCIASGAQLIANLMSILLEPWPKYQVLNIYNNDSQRAHLELNAREFKVDFNLRAEYCGFWGVSLQNIFNLQS